jgi:hypothetical protein
MATLKEACIAGAEIMDSRAGVVKKLLVLVVIAFGLLLTVPGTDAQKQPRQKDFKIAFSLLLPDGSLAELPEEVGPCNCVDEPFSGKLMTPSYIAKRQSRHAHH